MRTLGERFKRKREDASLTQEAVAFAAGTSVVTVRRLEADQHSPKVDTLQALAAAVGTTVAELLDDEEVAS